MQTGGQSKGLKSEITFLYVSLAEYDYEHYLDLGGFVIWESSLQTEGLVVQNNHLG